MIATFFKKNQPAHWLCLTSLLLLGLYRFTAPVGTTPEDASEFTLTAHFLGLPHPPGYPVFVWLGHFLSLFPTGSPAQQIALLSHLSIALTAGLLGYWAYKKTKSNGLSIWVTLTYGLSTFSWAGAQFVEVYPLHTFLMTLTFFLFFKLSEIENWESHKPLIFFAGLSLGFSLSNHYPLVVLAFPGLLFYLLTNKDTLFARPVFYRLGLGTFLGILPYSYLFFADNFSDFLFLGPISTFSGFLDYVLRKEYSQIDRTKVFTFFTFLQYFLEAGKIMFQAFTPLVLVSSVISLFELARKRLDKNWAIPLALGVFSSFFLLFLFWQPDYYLLGLELYQSFHGFALGCFLLLSLGPIERLLKMHRWKKGTAFALIAIPFFLLTTNFKSNDRRTDTFTKDFSDIIYSLLPPQSVLLVKGDADAGTLAYYHFLENVRPDISLITQAGTLLPKKLFDRDYDMKKNNHRIALLNFISANLSLKKPVFSTGPVAHFSPKQNPFPLPTKEYGLLTEIYDQDPAPLRDLSLAEKKTIEFLDKGLSPSFEPNFKHYRDLLLASACHSLLILGSEHLALNTFPRCQIIKAQWLHVEKKDFVQADSLFLAGLQGSSSRSKSDLCDVGKDFFVNRMKMIETLRPEPMEQLRLFRETVDITLPIALGFPICQNNLARKVYDLSLRANLVQEAQELRIAFSHCPIEAVPTPN